MIYTQLYILNLDYLAAYSKRTDKLMTIHFHQFRVVYGSGVEHWIYGKLAR